MVPAQNTKIISVASPALVDDADVTTTVIDTADWDYAEIFLQVGATDIALTALKLQESDAVNAGSLVSGADIPGTVYGTAKGIDGTTSALPSADDDGKIFKFELDLRGRKRYLDLVATVGDGTTGANVAAFAVLSRGKTKPDTAAEAGCAEILRV